MHRREMYAYALAVAILVAGLGSWTACGVNKRDAAMADASSGAVAKVVEPSHARTRALAEWESLQYGMFIHFGMNTLAQSEFCRGDNPPSVYAPTELDVDGWVRLARDAGMKYAVLTAKHTSGFCLWDSKVQWQGKEFDYDVASSPNKTDVVAEFMKACRKYRVRPGLYYCMLDYHNNPEGPLDAEGRGGVPAPFFQLCKDHVTELLRSYPGLYELWIDIPAFLSQPQRDELYALAKSVSPSTFVLFNGHGGLRSSEVRDLAWPADLLNTEQVLPSRRHYDPWHTKDGKKYYLPMENCETITPSWFWFPNEEPKTLQDLYKLYTKCRRMGINLLLNVGPDARGKMPQDRVDRLMELKRAIDNPALLGSRAPLIDFEKGGYGKWISRDATYEASSNEPEWSNGNEASLLSGEDYNAGFAFHTKEEADPYILIALKRKALVKGIEIVNRTDMVPERARTLTIWVSSDKKDWKEIWKAEDAQDEWTIPVAQSEAGIQRAGVEAQYVKIGLREKDYLHLYSVRVYGEMD